MRPQAGYPMPWGAEPMPGQWGAPGSPQVAGGGASMYPSAAPNMPGPQSPTTTPGGGQFFDDLLDEPGSSPLDELGLNFGAPAAAAPQAWPGSSAPSPPAPAYGSPPMGGQSPAASAGVGAPPFMPPQPEAYAMAAPASSAMDLGDADLQLRRPSRAPMDRAGTDSSTIIMWAGGAVAVLLLAVAAVLFVNRGHKSDTLADASTSGGDANPAGPNDLGMHGKTPTTIKSPSGTPNNPGKKPIGVGVHPVDVNGRPTHPIKPQPQTPGTPDKPETSKPEMPAPETPKPETPKPEMPAPETPKPTPEPAKPAAVDPAQLAKLRRTLAAARTKLAERNQEEAKKLVALAIPMATSQDQHDMVDRMDALEKYVGEFWGAVRDAVNGLKATDEFDVGTSKVIVVDKGPDSITIHVGGQNRQFQFKQLPSGLAVALAKRWLDEKNPKNKVFIGAFYAVDPKSDPQDAKKMWDEAVAAGVDEAKTLFPLLQPEAADTAATTGGDTGGQMPVPDADALTKVEKHFKDEFETAYLEAINSVKKGELAKKLVEEGESSTDPARQFLMWREARDLAADAGQPAIMVDAIDHLGRQFRIDPLDMKADTLTTNPPRNSVAGKAVNGVAMALIDEAVAAKRFALADRFARLALESARKANNTDMAKKAIARAKEVQAMAAGDGSSQ